MYPMPHKCSIYRADRVEGVYEEPKLIASNVSCLLAPSAPMVRQDFYGHLEMVDSVLFVEYDVDIRVGDEIYWHDGDEWWVVVETPLKYYNPITWETDHQQVTIRKKPIS